MRTPLQTLNLQLAVPPALQRIAEQQACTAQGSSQRALKVAQRLGSMSVGNSFQWGCAAAAQGVSHAALPAQPADPMRHEADASLDGRVTQPGGPCSEALRTALEVAETPTSLGSASGTCIDVRGACSLLPICAWSRTAEGDFLLLGPLAPCLSAPCQF